ncbi:MAG: DUF2807 domain-containing protein [Dysgonamonadaceae bacterium]|jgi:hypothetical protein|nr:DUF2807 domain-containing protein [Dysgonamonadaceae bacterium]
MISKLEGCARHGFRDLKMKRTLSNFFVATLVIGFFSVCTSCINISHERGNGKLTTSEVNSIYAFDKISAASSPEVHYYASDEYRVILTVDSNLKEYVEIFTRNNTLTIKTEKGVSCSFTKFLVEVYCPVLTDVSMSGSCKFKCFDEIITPSFGVDISGSGKADVMVDCSRFSGKISGSGKVTAIGSAANANIDISGSGVFEGYEFDVKNATVKISGSGKVNISVENDLNANISGSGEVNYRGNPTVNTKISGSGKVREK